MDEQGIIRICIVLYVCMRGVGGGWMGSFVGRPHPGRARPLLSFGSGEQREKAGVGSCLLFFFATASLRFVLSCVFCAHRCLACLMGRAGLRVRFCALPFLGASFLRGIEYAGEGQVSSATVMCCDGP